MLLLLVLLCLIVFVNSLWQSSESDPSPDKSAPCAEDTPTPRKTLSAVMPGSVGSEKLVVTITGRQAPDALARVMTVLGESNNTKLTNFAQLVVRDKFIATCVLAPFQSAENGEVDAVAESFANHADYDASSGVLKDIVVRAYSEGFHVDFDATRSMHRERGALPPDADVVSERSYMSEQEDCDDMPDTDFLLTMFSPRRIEAQVIADAADILARYDGNVNAINRLSDEDEDYMCIELKVTLPKDEDAVGSMRRDLFALGREGSADIALQPARLQGMAKRIVVFDLSWTLVQCDAVDAMLEAAGVQPAEEDVARRRAGDVSDEEWLRLRVSLLEGKNADAVNQAAFETLRYTNGAAQLCKGLRKLGCRLAVVSSGSFKIAAKARDDLGLHFAYGNKFEVTGAGKFTGRISEPFIDAARKAELMQTLAVNESVGLEQIIAVGDGPVSSKMLEAAGMSVAFDQPDSVEGMQTGRISSKTLASVFFVLGVTGRDFRELVTAQ